MTLLPATADPYTACYSPLTVTDRILNPP